MVSYGSDGLPVAGTTEFALDQVPLQPRNAPSRCIHFAPLARATRTRLTVVAVTVRFGS